MKTFMKTQDALNILNISVPKITLDIIKDAYKAACLKYHPDHNGDAGLEMMQLVNVAYNVLKKLCKTDFFDHFTNAPKRGSQQQKQADNGSTKQKQESNSDNDSSGFAYDFGEEIFNALKYIFSLKHNGLKVELCGNWLWITGDTKPVKDKIKTYTSEDGNRFRWCRKKVAWSYRPEEWKSYNRQAWSMDQIREGHGSREFRSKQH